MSCTRNILPASTIKALQQQGRLLGRTFFARCWILLALCSCCRAQDNLLEYLKVTRYGNAEVHSPDGPNYHSQFSPSTVFPLVHKVAHRKSCLKLEFSAPVEGAFYRDSVGHTFYELRDCNLRRMSHKETRNCLAGTRIVFLGDSVTRFQYLALVQFLAAGYYPHPYDDGSPSVTNNHHWGTSWPDFYEGVLFVLRKYLPEGAKLTCDDCVHTPTKVTEHWHFELPNEPGGSIILDYSYIWNKPSFQNSTAAGLLWAFASGVVPDLVLVNQGAFFGLGTKENDYLPVVKQLLKEGRAIAADATTQLIWKTATNSNLDKWAPTVQQYAAEYGWKVYDVRAIVKAAERQHLSLTWNKKSVHLFPVAYEQFNDLLLNIVCKF